MVHVFWKDDKIEYIDILEGAQDNLKLVYVVYKTLSRHISSPVCYMIGTDLRLHDPVANECNNHLIKSDFVDAF